MTILLTNGPQAFSPDSRWIVSTSLDSVIRTFDIPTGGLIDAFRTPSIATSIAFSPVNDFLATAHVDSVGVFLWANRAQFSEVTLRTVSENDITEVSMPSMQGEVEDDGISRSVSSIVPWLMHLSLALEALTGLALEDTPVDVFSSPLQLDGDLVTLTLLPRSRWQTLLNLEVIQVRVSVFWLRPRVNWTEQYHSNETNRQSRPKSLNKHPSSSLHCPVSSIGLPSKKRWKKRLRRRRAWTKPWPNRRAFSKQSWQTSRRAIVSMSATSSIGLMLICSHRS